MPPSLRFCELSSGSSSADFVQQFQALLYKNFDRSGKVAEHVRKIGTAAVEKLAEADEPATASTKALVIFDDRDGGGASSSESVPPPEDPSSSAPACLDGGVLYREIDAAELLVIEVVFLAVREEARGRGVGSALVDQLKKASKCTKTTKKPAFIVVSVKPGRASFWEKQGLRRAWLKKSNDGAAGNARNDEATLRMNRKINELVMPFSDSPLFVLQLAKK